MAAKQQVLWDRFEKWVKKNYPQLIKRLKTG
jgi:hypothetical protein